MLSVLSGYERSRDRETDSAFKNYPPHHHSVFNAQASANYPPFSSSAYHKSLAEGPMDLRPTSHHSMYDSRMYHDSGYADMSNNMHKYSSVKSEAVNSSYQPLVHHITPYPQVSSSLPSHHMYTPLSGTMSTGMGMKPEMLNLPSSRPEMGQPDMNSPPQASIPNVHHSANSPLSSSQAAANLFNSIGLNSSSDRSESSARSTPEALATTNTSPPTATKISASPRMPPKKRKLEQTPEESKDEDYWVKRKKNNESAKRSREARRMKEEQTAVRVVYLEQENLQLRTELSILRNEVEKLRAMVYSS